MKQQTKTVVEPRFETTLTLDFRELQTLVALVESGRYGPPYQGYRPADLSHLFGRPFDRRSVDHVINTIRDAEADAKRQGAR